MQKKYIELFRPKEIQEMVTSGGLNTDLLETSHQQHTTVGTSTFDDTKREVSPSAIHSK